MITVIVGTIGALILALLTFHDFQSMWLWFGFLVWLFWAFVALCIECQGDQTRLRGWADWLPLPYTKVMDWLLSGLPRWLLPDSTIQSPPPASVWKDLDWYHQPRPADGADKIRLSANPWSWPVFDLALRVAIAYPLLFALCQWTWTGQSTGLGGLELFPEGIHWAIRWATLCLLASLITTRILASATSKGVFEKLSTWLLGAAFAAALAGTVATALAGATTVAFAVAGAAAVATALAGAVAAALAGATAVAVTVAVAGAVAVAVAVAFAVAGAVAWAARGQRGGLGYAALWILAVAGSCLAAVILPADRTLPAIWIVAFALLPVINALFDWLSYGFTIWLLRLGHRKRGVWPLVFGAIDAVAAVIMFFVLSLTLVTVLAWINLARGDTLVDVGLVLAGVRDAPGQYLWAIAMVGSTLVPTLVHVAIALLSLVGWIPVTWWQGMARAVEGETSQQRALVASFGLAILLLLYALVPAGLLSGLIWLIWEHGGGLRVAYADLLADILAGWGLL